LRSPRAPYRHEKDCLRLTRITTHSFRNLSSDPVFFGGGRTVIAGENAQGKTNLLEAIALVCGQRSFRGARPQEMAAGETGFRVEAVVEREAGPETLAVEWSPGTGRSFSRAGKEIGFREVSRLAPAVFLSPEHRELLTGGRAARRRFLDRLALFCRAAAGEDLARFERALSNRNALLTRTREGSGGRDAAEMDAWTEEFVRAGAAVRRHRSQALAEWLSFFGPLCLAAGPDYAAIRVHYSAGGESEEDLRAACARLSPAERRRGHSLAGPQRDDLAWTRGDKPLAATASAGELSRVVALTKLAEWRAVARAAGEAPLFGVDEFDASLSAGGVEAFVEVLPPAETVLLTTASEPSRWRRLAGAAAIIEMRAGCVHERPHAVNNQGVAGTARAHASL
jgi:DNA replication and repair protein RecF